VSGFGQHTREVRSYRAVSLHFVVVLQKSNDDVTPKEARIAFRDTGERGLAQSGRPRRAKRRRTASRGGKIARSSTRRAGARKSIVGLFGIVSVEDASDRGSRSLFTGRAGKTISAESEHVVARA